MRSTHAPESTLAELVERIAALRVAPHELFILGIGPVAVANVEEWKLFCRGLCAGAASRRVGYLLFHKLELEYGLSWSWGVHDFELPVAGIPDLLRASITAPTTSTTVRIDHMIMLAGFLLAERNTTDAMPLLKETIALSDVDGAPGQRWKSRWAMGNGLLQAGRPDLSENAYADSAEQALLEGNMGEVAQSFLSAGHARFVVERYSAAIEAYEVAEDHFIRTGYTVGVCYVRTWIAEAHRHLGHFEEAEQILLSVLAQYGELKEPLEDPARQGAAEVYGRLARLYEDMKRNDIAQAFLERARANGCTSIPEQPV